MKKVTAAAAALLIGSLALGGCDSTAGTAGLGVLGGAAAGAGGYEYHLNRQMARVEEDRKQNKIDQREYDIRKDQIKRDSAIQ